VSSCLSYSRNPLRRTQFGSALCKGDCPNVLINSKSVLQGATRTQKTISGISMPKTFRELKYAGYSRQIEASPTQFLRSTAAAG
jgi:hypothetical protein